jgi:hypothetical protein
VNTQPGAKHRFSSKLSLSYIAGVQLYNDYILYNPGYSVLFTESYRLVDNVEIGMGSGYLSLQNERFIPVYIDAVGYKKNSINTPVIRFQLGYSAAWFRMVTEFSDYKLAGGLYFSAGMGRQFRLNDRYSVLFHWSYCHQSARALYQVFGIPDYAEGVNYDMIRLSFEIIRN